MFVKAESVPLTLDDLAKVFSTYFPKVEGLISKVEEGKGVINIGRKEGLVNGMILSVYRTGSPFYHPITGEKLGDFEETMGFFELADVGDHESRGILQASGLKPEKGDHVRLSAARIPVEVTGENEKNNLVLMDEFSRSLIDTNRFSVVSFSLKKNGSQVTPQTPLFEFRLKTIPGESVKVELYNKPFNHRVEEFSTSIGRLQEVTGGNP